mmetsp:Transcript_12921/g.29337  ORF Transcript_12921/g.29337 Transcript_12921/m.29337 type:complete len:286 (-) Transcript_12921:385-1242(-)
MKPQEVQPMQPLPLHRPGSDPGVHRGRAAQTPSPEEAAAHNVRGLRQDTALTADLHLRRTTLATVAVRRRLVRSTGLMRAVAPEAEVSCLTERRAPAVSDDPVLRAVLIPIAHEHNGMVDIHGLPAAGIEDAAVVKGPEGGVHTHGDRAMLGDGVHQGLRVIGRQLDVAADASHRRCPGACARRARDAALIRVGPHVGNACQDGVVEGQCRGGPLAASSSSAPPRVRRARVQLLRRERHQHPGLDGDVRLQDLHSRKGPTTATAALVLHRADYRWASQPPVDALR